MSKCACPAPTPVLDEMAGETVCSKCARVLDDSIEQPCRDQGQNNMMFRHRVSSTSIVGNKRMRYASQISNKVDQKGVTVDYMIKSCCAKLGIPQTVADRAMIIFGKFKKSLGYGSPANHAAAVVYMACREHCVARGMKEVFLALNADSKKARHAYYNLHKSMDADLPIPNATGYATRLASDLKLSEKTARRALKVLERLNGTEPVAGHGPVILAAYATYVALDLTEGVTPKMIADAAGIMDGILYTIDKTVQADEFATRMGAIG